MTSKMLVLLKDGYMYSWDHDNHLTEVKDSSGSVLATYIYDALGRRVRSTLRVPDSSGSSSMNEVNTDYYYNGWQLLTEVITDAAP